MKEYRLSNLLNKPLKDIFIENKLFDETLPMDEYHISMAQSDFLLKMHEKPVVKTYFYRQAPFKSSYIITAGLTGFLSKLYNFSYSQIIPYLEYKGYNKEFIAYVKSRNKIKVKVYSLKENTPAFPNEPIIILESNLFDSRILEGIILSEMNFASVSATKWHRIVNSAQGCSVMEFGRRRAQNILKSSLYSYMAGISFTSNCEAEYYFGIPASGTIGHEYIQSFTSEYDAFCSWIETNPHKPCLLVDTIDTISSGIENAVKTFIKYENYLKDNNSWHKIGVRIDSGDLAYLAVTCYNILREKLGTENINIVLSNDLDEYSINSIFAQLYSAGQSCITKHLSFGVGTKGVTAWDYPALGGVCKITELEDNYIMKLSNNSEKTTIPGNLRSRLVLDNRGQYITTLIQFHNETDLSGKFYHINDDTKYILNSSKLEFSDIRQSLVYASNGEQSSFYAETDTKSLQDIRNSLNSSLSMLDWSYKRIIKPHRSKVSLSEKVFYTRKDMMKHNQVYKKADKLF